MSAFLDLAISPLLLVLCVLAGAALPGRLAGTTATHTRTFALALCAVIGVVVLHTWMLLLDFVGVGWSRLTVIVPLALVAGLGARRVWRTWRGRRASSRHHPLLRGRLPAWSDLLVLAALVGFAILLLRPCLTMPDVVFHWGIKAHRATLAGGIDYAFMQQPWNFNKHADYPYLVPNLYTAGAILRGHYSELTFLPWTLGYLALLAAGVREAFAGRRDLTAQATLVVAVFVTTAFAINHLLGGSPDLLLAAVLVAAVPAIVAPAPTARAGASAVQIGWLAALAIGAKYEGGPLAALLVGACTWQLVSARAARRHALRLASPRLASLRLAYVGPLVVPGAVVAVIWWQQVWRQGLAQGNRAGAFDLSRASMIGEGVLAALGHPSWQGFAWVVLLLPALLLIGRVRTMAAVVLGQLAVYAWVYFSTPLDVGNLMATSAERLLVHVVPVTLLLGGLALSGPALGGPALGGATLGRGAPGE